MLDYNYKNLSDLSKDLQENYEIIIPFDEDFNKNLIRINPFIINKITQNPFNLPYRLYPVDFGYKRKHTLLTSIEFPSNYKVKHLPEDKVISLPNKSGTLFFKTNIIDNKISVYLKYQLNKEIFKSNEYQYLKEFYNQIIQIQKNEIIIEKK